MRPADENLSKGAKYEEHDKDALIKEVERFYQDNKNYALEVANHNILVQDMVENEWNYTALNSREEWVAWYDGLSDETIF